jgi:hypothetical protein
MKRTKKPLALLLALALALALSAPAMAIDRNDITITGPEGLVTFGEAFTLRIDVKNLPAGTEIASYQWRVWRVAIDGATASTLRVAPGDAAYPIASDKPYEASGEKRYDCVVTFVEKDTGGNVIDTITVESREVRLRVGPEREKNFWEKLWDSLFVMPFTNGVGFAAMSSVMSGYLLLPLFPVTFVIGWLIGLFAQPFAPLFQ